METLIRILNNFISSKGKDEQHVMHSKSGSIKIVINYEADEVTKELINSI